MKLILHDLTPELCSHIGLTSLPSDQFQLIDSNKISRYCIGCFGCWLKTPGTCVIKDDFQNMGKTLSKVDEFIIISRSSFGGYSSSVKNVLDRSISYVMPYFEIRKGEMHHAERYHKNLVVSAIIYGEDMTDLEKETSQNLLTANALNLNGTIGKLEFYPSAKDIQEVWA